MPCARGTTARSPRHVRAESNVADRGPTDVHSAHRAIGALLPGALMVWLLMDPWGAGVLLFRRTSPDRPQPGHSSYEAGASAAFRSAIGSLPVNLRS